VLEGDDVLEVAEPLAMVEAVPDDESVGALESDVAKLRGNDATHRLVEQRAHLERCRPSSAKRVEQVRERQARIDDVLDEQHVAILSAGPRRPRRMARAHAVCRCSFRLVRSRACLSFRDVDASSVSAPAAARRASGLRWRSVGATMVSKNVASRSAKCLYIVR